MSEFDDINPVQFAAWLSTLPEGHPMQVAARVAVEVAELRRDRRRALRDASLDVAGSMDWARYAAGRVPLEELQRRRAVPGPLAG